MARRWEAPECHDRSPAQKAVANRRGLAEFTALAKHIMSELLLRNLRGPERLVDDQIENQDLVSPEALDFPDMLLQYDHQSRQEKPWSEHPYFNTVMKDRSQMGSSRRLYACQQPRYVRDFLSSPVIAAASLLGVPVPLPLALSKSAPFCLLSLSRGSALRARWRCCTACGHLEEVAGSKKEEPGSGSRTSLVLLRRQERLLPPLLHSPAMSLAQGFWLSSAPLWEHTDHQGAAPALSVCPLVRPLRGTGGGSPAPCASQQQGSPPQRPQTIKRAARDMAGIGDVVLTAGGSGGAAGPDESGTLAGWWSKWRAAPGQGGCEQGPDHPADCPADGDQWQGVGPPPSFQVLRESGRGPGPDRWSRRQDGGAETTNFTLSLLDSQIKKSRNPQGMSASTGGNWADQGKVLPPSPRCCCHCRSLGPRFLAQAVGGDLGPGWLGEGVGSGGTAGHTCPASVEAWLRDGERRWCLHSGSHGDGRGSFGSSRGSRGTAAPPLFPLPRGRPHPPTEACRSVAWASFCGAIVEPPKLITWLASGLGLPLRGDHGVMAGPLTNRIAPTLDGLVPMSQAGVFTPARVFEGFADSGQSLQALLQLKRCSCSSLRAPAFPPHSRCSASPCRSKPGAAGGQHIQQGALELGPPQAAPPLRQEPPWAPGRVLHPEVLGPQFPLGPALAPQLQLERLLEVVKALEVEVPPALHQEEPPLPPGLVLELGEEKRSPRSLHVHLSPKDRTQLEPRTHHRTSSPLAVQQMGGLRRSLLLARL
ncbi:hypothetical protein QTO34_005523 [Cnephaeus nilssonii]|uniref:Uncharacterized protein n=1 Tax=Cnephaeus nilssonii TaxID=3371016 RepID=A0AA40LJG4_CNENI|nr:hypothetical protein QTO34_005523 [Eptesicus nilssonii]